MEELEQRGTQRDVHMFSSRIFVMENSHRGPLLAAVHQTCGSPIPRLTKSCSRCVAGVILQADIPHFFARPGSSHPDKKAAGAGLHHLRK